MKTGHYLLPYKFRILGWFLLFAGMVVASLYLFSGLRFTMPVFAVFSYYIEAKYLAVFQTNFADELTLFMLLAGLFIIAFTKEKAEQGCCDEEVMIGYQLKRGNALHKSLFYNSIFLIFSILFIYGQGFVAVLIINLFSTLILYLLFKWHSK